MTNMKTFTGVLLICLIVGLSDGLDLSAKLSNLKSKSIIQTLKNKTESVVSHLGQEMKQAEEYINDFFKNFADTQNVCSKNGSSMKCCAKDLLKNYLCLGFNINAQNFSVDITFSMNNKTLIDETVSGQNPPAICVPLGLPILKFCVEPYDLGYSNETFTACVAISARISSKDIARLNLNCMKVSKSGELSIVGASNAIPGKSAINIDTSKVNPFMNSTVNPISSIKSLLKRN